MKKIVLIVIVFCFYVTAHASDSVVDCWIPHMTHAPHFYINSDGTLTVESSGVSLNNPPKNSPVVVKIGKVVTSISTTFEGDEPEIKEVEKKIFKISEKQGNVVLTFEVSSSISSPNPGTVKGLVIGKSQPRDWGEQSVFCRGEFEKLETMTY